MCPQFNDSQMKLKGMDTNLQIVSEKLVSRPVYLNREEREREKKMRVGEFHYF